MVVVSLYCLLLTRSYYYTTYSVLFLYSNRFFLLQASRSGFRSPLVSPFECFASVSRLLIAYPILVNYNLYFLRLILRLDSSLKVLLMLSMTLLVDVRGHYSHVVYDN